MMVLPMCTCHSADVCIHPVTALTASFPTLSTNELLDILSSRGVAASFFVVGNRIEWAGIATLQRAYREGHYIASHSHTHADFASLSLYQMRAELVAADAAIQRAICMRPRVFRPPYGSLPDAGVELVESMGYRIVNWNLDTEDWRLSEGAPPSVVFDRVQEALDGEQDGIIHLQHDLTGERAG